MTKQESGRRIMREIIGSEYADRRDKSRNNFNSPLRDFSEESCFGGVWADDTLPRKTRSLLCLVMLTALGRTTEFRIHVGAALNNGCTAEEIRSTLLQATIYCGSPAGNESFRIAEEVLSERNMLPTS
jgi:4-carboxymuconolactone decarboxylase